MSRQQQAEAFEEMTAAMQRQQDLIAQLDPKDGPAGAGNLALAEQIFEAQAAFRRAAERFQAERAD